MNTNECRRQHWQTYTCVCMSVCVGSLLLSPSLARTLYVYVCVFVCAAFVGLGFCVVN